jgi:hypothetical protein
MAQRTSRWLIAFALLALLTAFAAASATAASGAAKPDVKPKFTTEGGVDPQYLVNARTIAHWSFRFTDPTNDVTYPITMVGTDPRNGNVATTVHTVIVPLKMNFVAGGQDTSILNDLGYSGFRATPLNHTFDGSRRVNDVLSSPAFRSTFTTPSVMGGDTAQVGDAFVRAQWNKIGTGYHVKISNDSVLPTQTLDVPANQGLAYQRPVGAWREANGYGPTDTITGVANYQWFSAQVQNMIKGLHVDPTTVPVFLTDNVLLYSGNKNYTNCCVIGYHGAGIVPGYSSGPGNGQGQNAVQTYMYSAWTTPGTYSGFLTDYTGTRSAPSPTRGLADIHAFSHEISEWLDDPFVNNLVQPWLTPTAPQYGCTAYLETGDPVVGVWFPYPGNNAAATTGTTYYSKYHPEDEVEAQWFGRGGIEPLFGAAYDHYLTFMGTLTTGLGGAYAGFGTYAQGC